METQKLLKFINLWCSSKPPDEGRTIIFDGSRSKLILMEHGANPRLQDRDGWNALLFTQYGDHNEILNSFKLKKKEDFSESRQ